jgi:TfoX/Sxy family transcriptional regulator of competence genes
MKADSSQAENALMNENIAASISRGSRNERLLKEGIMASSAGFVAMVCEQMRGAGDVSARKMFGEYAIYCGGKVVALVCDDQLFLKPTAAGRVLLGSPDEGLPYPGAKLHFLITDGLDDSERLARLVKVTAEALPAPKPKKTRSASGSE